MADKRTADDLDDGTEVGGAPFDDTEEMPYAKLMEMLKADDEPGDDVAFGKGSDAPPAKDADQVSVEEGINLIDSANTKGRKDAKVQAPEPAKAEEPKAAEPEVKPEVTQEESAKPAEPPAEPDKPAPAPDDIDAMLDGLPDDRKTALRGRIGAADEVLAIFKGHEAELQRHGAKPADVVKRLVDLSTYAEKNPHDYLAWVATQFGDAADVLGKAAEKLGLKVVPVEASAEDDPFEDPKVKELRQELAAYRARERQPIGPDSPQARAQSELQALAASLPHWQTVAPQVAALSQTHAANGTPPTLNDIRRFYDAAVIASGIAPPPAPNPTPAAQPAPPVAQQAPTKTAADAERIERSRKASMSLDGSGQGAGRRPALDPDASIHSVLTTLMAEQSRG